MPKITTNQLLKLEVENIENELKYTKEIKSNTQKILDRRIRFLKNRLAYLNKQYGVGHSYDKTTTPKLDIHSSNKNPSEVHPTTDQHTIEPVIDNGSITDTNSATE